MKSIYEGKVVDLIQLISVGDGVRLDYNSVFGRFCSERRVEYGTWLDDIFEETLRFSEVLRLVFGRDAVRDYIGEGELAYLTLGMTEEGDIIPNYLECEEMVEELYLNSEPSKQEAIMFAMHIELKIFMNEIDKVLEDMNDWFLYQTPFPLDEAEADNVPL